MHAGGRRFDPAWLHQCGTRYVTVAIAKNMDSCPIFRRRESKARRRESILLFNNMVILSRAFWVQDGFWCDEHTFDRSEHRTVSAKQIRIVVFESVGVSPEEPSRTSVG